MSETETRQIPGALLRRIARDHWLVECLCCPRRLGQKHADTRREAEEWLYKVHFQRDSLHWKYRYPTPEQQEAKRQQQELLALIFKDKSANETT